VCQISYYIINSQIAQNNQTIPRDVHVTDDANDNMKDKADYKSTLNLPQTDFPMRGNLAQREPQLLLLAENHAPGRLEHPRDRRILNLIFQELGLQQHRRIVLESSRARAPSGPRIRRGFRDRMHA